MQTIPVNEPLMAGREAEYVRDCLETGWISSAGKYIERFEKEWAAYCTRRHGVAVCNGTVALELAVSALDLPVGAEVILPSFTIVSCLEAILRNQLVPVVVDCDPRTYCMDVNAVRQAATQNTAAVMPVHIYGHPVNMEPLLELSVERGWRVIEDAAERTAPSASSAARGAVVAVSATFRPSPSTPTRTSPAVKEEWF